MTDRTMYRYVVPVDDQPHSFKLTSDPVAVAATADNAAVEFWAEHDERDGADDRMFQVFGTGHPIPDDAGWIGTCPRTAHGLVWHLYEVSGR